MRILIKDFNQKVVFVTRTLVKFGFLLIFFVLLSCLDVQAQTLENIKTAYNGDRVIITYDLRYPDATQKFNLTVYSSYDNYTKPLPATTGDVYGVRPGTGLRILWDAKSVLPPDFNKDITFRLKPVVAIKLKIEPLKYSSYKRGKNLNVAWTGGTPNDQVSIELLKKDTVYRVLADYKNIDQTFIWRIPKNLKTGKDYAVRLTNLNDPSEVSTSAIFRVKPRIPLWAKAAPVVAAGAIILLTRPKEGDALPGPPYNP